MEYYILTYVGRQSEFSGESVDKDYLNLSNACQYCGSGASHDSNLPVKGIEKLKKDFFSTFSDDYIISQKVFEQLVDTELKLPGVKQVMDKKSNLLPFYHLTSNFRFPKFDEDSSGFKIDKQCTFCNRNGYFNEIIMGDLEKGIKSQIVPLVLKYSGIDKGLLEKADVFISWEHFGYSNLKLEGNRVLRIARPLLFVSQTFKDVFDSIWVKNAKYEKLLVSISE